MTELECVLTVAFAVVWWAYRRAERRADHFKALMLAIGVGAVRIQVDEENKTYKLEIPK